MAETKRIFLIVLDSLGIGAAPDHAAFGDGPEVNTLRAAATDPAFRCDNLRRLGLGHIPGVEWLGQYGAPMASVCRLREASRGKDTTTGHWEMAGLISKHPMPTYPNGFPPEIIEAFKTATGRGILCNQPASGTQIISELGQTHVETGDLIVYTSADSVFQIAAHEDIVPVETLYDYCRMARKILVGEHGVGRVIARPFVGEAGHFTRTANRRDFSLEPTGETMLDAICAAGKEVIGVGKISDIFAERGISRSYHTHSNEEGMAMTAQLAAEDFTGLCFVNLVDFDSAYGHRNDVHGYAAAIASFDAWLGTFLPLLREDDVLMITADHGCDPIDPSTDHTREYVPYITYGAKIIPGAEPLSRPTFADVAARVCALLDVPYTGSGIADRSKIVEEPLLDAAISAMQTAYAPYSGYKVGAAVLTEDGRLFTGCNVENASYGGTICAERTAITKAVSAGATRLSAIAVVGGRDGVITDFASPCGICRQVLSEFASETMPVILYNGTEIVSHPLGELLPLSFGPGNLIQ